MHKLLLHQLQLYPETLGAGAHAQLLNVISETYTQHDGHLKQLEDSATAWSAIFDATGEIIFAMDESGRLLKTNKMGREWLSDVAHLEGSGEIITWRFVRSLLLNPEHLIKTSRLLKKQPNQTLSGTLSFKTGRLFEYHSLPQWQQNKLVGRVWCLRDVTEEKKNEELMLHHAFHDALTGLPNRTCLLERIVSAIDSSKQDNKKIAVIFIDFDNFKKINDTEGHEAGDELLRCASKRIKECIRDTDFLSRLGGDEFVIVIEGGMSQTVLTRVCSTILNTMAQPFVLNKHKHTISCSMGISIYPRDDNVAEGLIGKADMAMYRAKELGKNSFQFYSQELERLALYQLEFESDLRRAIAADELSLFFQPQVEVRTQKIVAVEALVRWIRPNGSVVPPNQFIPVAEQVNLIHEVGRIVLEKVCQEIKRWRAMGIDNLTVAINISAREFLEKDFLKHIAKKLTQHKINGNRIVLEITESFFMEDKQAVLTTMMALKELGIEFAVDDFGMGYTSFNCLLDLPIQHLKIDRSFLKNIAHNKKHYALARSIIDIGRRLHLSVIAEGVEDQEALDFTLENQCAIAQGFFLHVPMSTDAFAELLRARYERRADT
jgi:diguanylate cyclase (GGDEF)-like protein